MEYRIAELSLGARVSGAVFGREGGQVAWREKTICSSESGRSMTSCGERAEKGGRRVERGRGKAALVHEAAGG